MAEGTARQLAGVFPGTRLLFPAITWAAWQLSLTPALEGLVPSSSLRGHCTLVCVHANIEIKNNIKTKRGRKAYQPWLGDLFLSPWGENTTSTPSSSSSSSSSFSLDSTETVDVLIIFFCIYEHGAVLQTVLSLAIWNLGAFDTSFL